MFCCGPSAPLSKNCYRALIVADVLAAIVAVVGIIALAKIPSIGAMGSYAMIGGGGIAVLALSIYLAKKRSEKNDPPTSTMEARVEDKSKLEIRSRDLRILVGITYPTHKTLDLQLLKTDTLESFKGKIAAEYNKLITDGRVDPENVRLIYAGRDATAETLNVL